MGFRALVAVLDDVVALARLVDDRVRVAAVHPTDEHERLDDGLLRDAPAGAAQREVVEVVGVLVQHELDHLARVGRLAEALVPRRRIQADAVVVDALPDVVVHPAFPPVAVGRVLVDVGEEVLRVEGVVVARFEFRGVGLDRLPFDAGPPVVALDQFDQVASAHRLPLLDGLVDDRLVQFAHAIG